MQTARDAGAGPTMRSSKPFLIPIVLAIAMGITIALLTPLARRSLREVEARIAKPADASVARPAAPASQRHWRRIWLWQAGAALSGAPAPLGDGWVFALEDGSVVALDGGGRRVRWTHAGSNLVFAGAAVVAGSNVVAVTAEGSVLALNAASGRLAWQTTVPGGMRHGPLAARVGAAWQVVVLSAADGVMHGLDAASGRLLWSSEPTNRSDGAPASDGRQIAYGNCDAAVHLFDASDGTHRAQIPVGADAQIAGGALLLDGRVYAGTRSGDLICADVAAGAVAWRQHVSGGEAFVTPVAAGDLVVMGTTEGTVAAFGARGGAERWRVSVSNAVTSLCILEDAVFAMAGGTLNGLRLADGARFASLPIGDNVLGPVCNGPVVMVVDDGGNAIAIAGE